MRRSTPRNLIPPGWRALQDEQNEDFRVKGDSMSEDLADSLHQRRENHRGEDKATKLLTLWRAAETSQAVAGSFVPEERPKAPHERQLAVFGHRLVRLGWEKVRKVWAAGELKQVRWFWRSGHPE